jgi:predicted amidohydrolase
MAAGNPYIRGMKIGVAQTRPVKGDIHANIAQHKKLIALAVELEANMLVFPELSITGYEPGLAGELATTQDDERFDDFQLISNGSKVVIGVGAPIQAGTGVMIGMVIFQPNKPRETYNKQHLHADELPFFIPGDTQHFLEGDKDKIALAICYEVFVPEHVIGAAANGATVYLCSVAKSAAGVARAVGTLTDAARNHHLSILMANGVGHCDDFDCGGKTMVIDNEGQLLAQLDDQQEGILIYDTETKAIIEKIL